MTCRGGSAFGGRCGVSAGALGTGRGGGFLWRGGRLGGRGYDGVAYEEMKNTHVDEPGGMT